ncbi:MULTISPECIES: pirin family protein [Aequorivita]|uniref:Pirin family protein n=1 Tax=Aequorivita iocasae TaxID=2803865 RepID=A0ABX7DU22_9FLAO|nr:MULTISPECIES: pirin family protein [Aequorivita]QQX76264.1 pirin family protein [Aequorivita iocasae]UCA55727.1 pirin family protein [Aequorivita sp. F7]
MSNLNTIIPERTANIGNFMVGRLLPFREKRMVGPFAFIDHMGPVEMDENENLDVPPHPHIGLSTLTYLFEGSIMHRDSLGSAVEITPGAVNWMTAGKGVVHSERTPENLRKSKKRLHGLQIWVALPKHLEAMEPTLHHTNKQDIPHLEMDGVSIKVIAGEVLGKKSPVPVHSKLYFIEVKSGKKRKVRLGDYLFGESGLYILEGNIFSEGNCYDPKQILVANDSKLCEFEIGENTTVYIFGGEPFPEERHIHWNFVATDKSIIEKAREDWKAQLFPKVSGETEFVPLPD